MRCHISLVMHENLWR